MPDDARSLSPRAQEILRRADEHVASLRAGGPARPADLADALPPTRETGSAARSEPPPTLQQVMDRVQAGLNASRVQLDALDTTLTALAHELGVPPAAPRDAAAPRAELPTSMPAGLSGHAHLPGERSGVEQERDAAAADDSLPGRPSGASQDAARLVAIEMAVAGDSREMVGERLGQEFAPEDVAEILDDVFGPGSGSGTRMR